MQRYQEAVQAHKNAVRILGANCAFISEEIYELFKELSNKVFSADFIFTLLFEK